MWLMCPKILGPEKVIFLKGTATAAAGGGFDPVNGLIRDPAFKFGQNTR